MQAWCWRTHLQFTSLRLCSLLCFYRLALCVFSLVIAVFIVDMFICCWCWCRRPLGFFMGARNKCPSPQQDHVEVILRRNKSFAHMYLALCVWSLKVFGGIAAPKDGQYVKHAVDTSAIHTSPLSLSVFPSDELLSFSFSGERVRPMALFTC